MATVGDLASLQYCSSSNGAYTTFANIEKITHNEVDAPEVKTTKLDSAAETSQPGIPDYGEISAQLRFDKSLVTTIKGWQDNKTVMWFKTTVNDSESSASADVTQGWIKKYKKIGDLERNKEVLADITIKVTGADVFTAGV